MSAGAGSTSRPPLASASLSEVEAGGSILQTTETTPLLGDNDNTPKPSSSESEEDGEEITVIAAPLSNTRLAITLGATYVGVFLGAVDASIIATLSGPIASEFHSLSLLSWLAAAYLIANATFQPLSGRLTDIFGRGPGLVFSNLMFALGNLICGLAQDQGTIIAGRVVAGIGGGGLMSISTFLASDLVPLKKRGVVQGLGNIAYGTGAMLGGVFGGFINDSTALGWRLAFLIQVPIIVISGGLVFFLVNVPPKLSKQSLLTRIDFLGSFLVVAFLVLVLLGLNAGGNVVPWTDPLVLTSIPLGFAMLFALIWWEGRVKYPIIPVKLLVERTVFTACLTNFCCSMVMMMTMFYVPLYLQVLGHTPTQAGLRILSSSLGVSISSIGSGYIMRRTGKYVGLGIFVLSVYTLAIVLNLLLNQYTPEWLPFVSMALHGAGYGAMLTVTLLACIAAVDHSQQAVITAATYAFRSIGTTLGITVASAVYQNILKAKLWERFGDLPGAAEEIERIRDDLGELGHLPEGWYDGVIQSFMDAFRGVWLTALALTVVGLISVSMMKQHKLHSNLARRDE
ncbi:major facilitator superfamily domain-containing protein [Podospora australis]|uniref:Major facilitator superfamily domain-containing protein n=1 Tax=Podospora australis TaxID=1536484 RepID=A0AAN6WUE7_9PEZI|nr:major facilitator superfamily domain-containing protein [Podospora australis]